MRYLLVIEKYESSVLATVKEMRRQPVYADLAIAVITRNSRRYKHISDDEVQIEFLECSFADDQAVSTALKPIYDEIAAVLCRGDQNIQFLRRTIPSLPPNVLVASPESLSLATNKHTMRQAFLRDFPEITPRFKQVSDASDQTIQALADSVGFPVIIKPANLASSLLIQACHNSDELKSALENTFEVIRAVYEREDRHETPEVIVEEYMDGDFYSIDAYVMDEGRFFYCPPVAYLPAPKIGVDDFFLYKRFVPTVLNEADVAAANDATRKALTAVGLTHSSAHVELIKTKDGWKIIEIGPRLAGSYRPMYKHGYGIDHLMNDIRIHFGEEPIIPGKLLKGCAAYSIYPHQEGELQSIEGLELIENDERVYNLKVLGKPGAMVKFAKHGGKALAEFVVADADLSKFNEFCAQIEQKIMAKVVEK